MNKFFSTALIIVIAVCGIAIYLFRNHVPLAASPISTSQGNVTSSPTVQLHLPVDVFGNTVPILGKSFVNTSTGATVSFTKKINFSDGSANGSVGILVNNKTLGTVPTSNHALFSFSPDGKYFGFRTYVGVGAYAFDSSLFVVDLKSNVIIGIPSPHKASDEVIDSYSWDGDAINVVSYIVTDEYTEKPASNHYYRTTPKELWRYDLVTKQYAFTQDLPETSSSTP